MEILHPNRDKAAVKATRATVILLLLVSIALMLVVTFGGWKALVGAKPIGIAYILVYVLLAIFAVRWNRGVLPLAAALGIVLGIFAAVAGPAWFARDKTGFTQPALNADLLGLLSLVIIPVQILLIAFCARALQHGWNVEVERPLHGRSPSGFGDDAQPHPA